MTVAIAQVAGAESPALVGGWLHPSVVLPAPLAMSAVSLRLPPGPLGVKLGERDPDGSGYACAVVRFNAVRGEPGALEKSGRVGAGDVIIGVGGQTVQHMDYDETVSVLTAAARPVVLSFCPPDALEGAKPGGTVLDIQPSAARELDEPLLPAALDDLQERPRPAADGGFVQKRAYICPLIFLGNVAVFVVSIYENAQPTSRLPNGPPEGLLGWFEPMGLNPMLGPNTQVLYRMGAKDTAEIVRGGPLGGGTWRIFAAMWLHAGMIHIASNMYGLYNAGFPGEKAHGWWKILLIYMVSGIMGNVISSIFLPTNITVGASGAVFGLFGAMWGDFIQNCGLYKGARCAQLFSLLMMTVINLGFGAVIPMIDNFAHVGGFVAGLLGSLVLFARPRVKRKGETKCSQKLVAILAAVRPRPSRGTTLPRSVDRRPSHVTACCACARRVWWSTSWRRSWRCSLSRTCARLRTPGAPGADTSPASPSTRSSTGYPSAATTT